MPNPRVRTKRPTVQQRRDAALGIDRRQRLAAVQLLMAFDCPAPAHHASQQMLHAAKLLPGILYGEVLGLGENTRKLALEAARDLIDQMLAEIK